MAKNTPKAPEFMAVKKSQLPGLIVSVVFLFGAIFIILQQAGAFKSGAASNEVTLEIRSMPIPVVTTFDRDTLSRIIPCDKLSGILARPGLNCLDYYYSPGADPIKEPEGRPNPFEKF